MANKARSKCCTKSGEEHEYKGQRVRAHFGQSNFSFFQQKRKKEILLILSIFTYFKAQTKIEKKKMVRKIDHFFIFLILKSASEIQKILAILAIVRK